MSVLGLGVVCLAIVLVVPELLAPDDFPRAWFWNALLVIVLPAVTVGGLLVARARRQPAVRRGMPWYRVARRSSSGTERAGSSRRLVPVVPVVGAVLLLSVGTASGAAARVGPGAVEGVARIE